jgi:hypothetical protein
MSFNRPSRRLIIPLSQSFISIRAQAIADAGRRQRAAAPIGASTKCRAARQHRPVAAFNVDTLERGMGDPATRRS